MNKTIETNSDYKILTPLEMEIDDLKHAQSLPSLQLVDKYATVEITNDVESRINKVSNDVEDNYNSLDSKINGVFKNVETLHELVDNNYDKLKADNKELAQVVIDNGKDIIRLNKELRILKVVLFLTWVLLIFTK